jgi:beta-lactamase regulating signal transducer with metallopeptidase domain/uncharacterized membrane protein YkoI
MRIISQLLLTFLLNACWQIALVAAVASLCTWLLRKAPARQRHLVWVAALVISLGLPVLTTSQLLSRAFFSAPATQQTVIAPPVTSQVPSVELNSSEIPATSDLKTPVQINGNLVAGLVALYALFLFYRGVKLFRAWRRTRAVKRSAHPVDLPESVKAILGRCQTAIGVTRFQILNSPTVPVPITVGFRKPLIILPEQLLREGDADVLTSALGHELVHVQRRDYLLNLIYELIYLPLSFHPAAALVRRRINQTRELGCDETVAEKLLTAEVYARSLVQLAGSAGPWGRATITVGITDADILEVRIMSLLSRPRPNVRRKKLLLVAVSLLLAVPCVAAASFAFRFDIDPGKSILGSPQEPSREGKEKETRAKREREEQEVQAREDRELKEGIAKETNPEKRAKLEAILKRRQEERTQAEGTGWAVTMQGNTVELRARRAQEEEEMKARQAQLARLAQITMEQAIQIATSQTPGKVLECSLIGEHWEAPEKLAKDSQVLYHVVILTGDETKPATTHVLVNAIDGTIFKTGQEERRKEERKHETRKEKPKE